LTWKQGTFTHFRYEIDPFEAREEAQRQARYDDDVAITQVCPTPNTPIAQVYFPLNPDSWHLGRITQP
jgi:hypothetical protein